MSENVNLKKYELANKWIHLLNKKISILENLTKKGINSIIIYGASDFALRLIEQCENEQIVKVLAIADKAVCSEGGLYKSIPLITIDKMQGLITDSTCIVITAMGVHEEIVSDFRNREIEKFILLSDLIYDAY